MFRYTFYRDIMSGIRVHVTFTLKDGVEERFVKAAKELIPKIQVKYIYFIYIAKVVFSIPSR